MSETTFSAQEILEIMQSGARLKNFWKPRHSSSQKAEKLWILVWPDGKKKKVQRSAVDALVGMGKLHTRLLQGGLLAYYLPEEVQS
jgi:hypothetical protein